VDPAAATLQLVFRLAAPEAVLVLAAFVVFLGAAFRPGKLLWGVVTLAAFAGSAAVLAWDRPDLTRLVPTASAVWPDAFALFTRTLALAGGAVLLLASWDELPEPQAADYFACLLVVSAGLGLVGSATELVTMFLALELISIPTYVMLYLPRSGRPVQEAAVKYFLLSIFSSAFLLFGFSYLYGVTGTTNLPAIHEALARGDVNPLPAILLVAAVMVIAGLGFRIAAVPFHFYAPDVYEGSAVGPAALLAFVPKVAGFVALLRIDGLVGPGPVSGNAMVTGTQLPLLAWILAAVTMTVGNVVALWQNDLKRLLAYSGIAHGGYMLMGLAAAPYLAAQADPAGGAVSAMLVYLIAYGAMTVGAFAVIQAISTRDRPATTVDDLAGLGATHPGLALMLAVFLFSLIGLPFTAGFVGKFLLFVGVLSAPGQPNDWLFRLLAVIGAINAAIGAYYYLRIIGVLYLRTALKPLPGRASFAGLLALWACLGVTVWLGVYPAPAVRFARDAARPVYHTGVAAR
jgi:NADH-quinone oxidoreductase subunit N